MHLKTDSRGITLIELIIAITLLAVVLTGAYSLLSFSSNSFRDMEAQYIAEEEARIAVISMENDIRRAQSAYDGVAHHKAVEVLASGMQLNVYTNIDNDTEQEIVQYILTGNKLKRGTAELGSVPVQWITLISKVRNNLLAPAAPIFVISNKVVSINLIITDEKERLADEPISICTSITVRSRGAMD